MDLRLRITREDDKTLLFEAISGIDELCTNIMLRDLLHEEVEIDSFSKKALLENNNAKGVVNIYFNVVMWGNPNPKILIPISQIHKYYGADEWLQELKTID